MKNRIILLGASGRTGKLILEALLDSGYEVNCLLRNSHRIPQRKGVYIFEGNPDNPEDLEKAIINCEHAICVLNISRTWDFPWARIRTPKNYLSQVMSTLIPLAESHKLKRIMVCSAWGVAETKEKIPIWFKWLIDYSNIGVAYQDHERQEQLIAESKLSWTIVRPVGLTSSKKERLIHWTIENESMPSLTISRNSLARFMVNCVSNEEFIHHKISISNA